MLERDVIASTIHAVIIRGQLLRQLMVCLAIGLNQYSFLLFSKTNHILFYFFKFF